MVKRKVSVRVEEDVCKALEAEAERNGTTLSKEIVRRLETSEVVNVDAGKVDALRSALVLNVSELNEKNRLAKKAGNNLNQMTKQLNANAALLVNEDNVKTLRKQLDLLQKVVLEEIKTIETVRERTEEMWRSLR